MKQGERILSPEVNKEPRWRHYASDSLPSTCIRAFRASHWPIYS